ncbi:hypothetical protein, partial [Nocardia abscessus]|uniref:hypothetical protein n=1 Tax=Nocardia abscessus TaxID=120957 RepID=UPI0024557012
LGNIVDLIDHNIAQDPPIIMYLDTVAAPPVTSGPPKAGAADPSADQPRRAFGTEPTAPCSSRA